MQMNGQEYVAVSAADTARGGRLHPSLPQRPGFDTVPAEADKPAPKPGKKLTYQQQAESLKAGLAAMSGSNADIVNNRKAIRMANMSAAEKLKAELEGDDAADEAKEENTEDAPEQEESMEEKPAAENGDADVDEDEEDDEAEEDVSPGGKRKKRGRTSRHRKARRVDAEESEEEEEEEDDDEEAPANPEDEVIAPAIKKKLKVNPDGTVDYEDTVRYVTDFDLR